MRSSFMTGITAQQIPTTAGHNTPAGNPCGNPPATAQKTTGQMIYQEESRDNAILIELLSNSLIRKG